MNPCYHYIAELGFLCEEIMNFCKTDKKHPFFSLQNPNLYYYNIKLNKLQMVLKYFSDFL